MQVHILIVIEGAKRLKKRSGGGGTLFIFFIPLKTIFVAAKEKCPLLEGGGEATNMNSCLSLKLPLRGQNTETIR